MTTNDALDIGAIQLRRSWTDLGCMGGLLLLAVLGFVLIQPSGDFPLNDDWAFILPVKWWHEQGRLQFTDWQFMTLIGQVVVGTLLAEITGFSITSLRWLVIVLAITSVCLIYGTARAMKATPTASLLTALLLLCNPIFTVTAASFMTDIPFLAACLASVYLRVTTQRDGGKLRLMFAWLFVVLACSIRQAGIALALGFVAYECVQHRSVTRVIRNSVMPTLVIAVMVVIYPHVLEKTIGLPSMFNQPTDEVKYFIGGVLHLRLGLLLMALKNLLVAIGYLGLCLAPLLPMIVRSESKWRRLPMAIGVSALCAIALIASGRAVPVAGNTFFDFGLGVRTLPDALSMKTAPTGFWWAIAFVVGTGVTASLFAAASLRWRRPTERLVGSVDGNACMTMLATILCVYNIPFLMRGGLWFDRYTLLNLALFGLLIAPFLEFSRRTWIASALTGAMLAAFSVFGIAGTHDYLEWNRKRWLAAEELSRREGIDWTQIDGGFEYNNYQPRSTGDRRRVVEAVNIGNRAAKYRLSFSPLPGHALVSIYLCETWLYGSPSAIYVLRALGSPGLEAVSTRPIATRTAPP